MRWVPSYQSTATVSQRVAGNAVLLENGTPGALLPGVPEPPGAPEPPPVPGLPSTPEPDGSHCGSPGRSDLAGSGVDPGRRSLLPPRRRLAFAELLPGRRLPVHPGFALADLPFSGMIFSRCIPPVPTVWVFLLAGRVRLLFTRRHQFPQLLILARSDKVGIHH